MEIEEVARTSPRRWPGSRSTRSTGVDAAKAAEIVAAGRLPRGGAAGAAALAERLWAVFADEDATLVEVNPLVLTGDGRVLALDGKVTLDDNAAFRHDCATVRRPDAPPTRSRRGPRPSTSTTSSSTARSASSATARAWSCPPSTSSPTPARSSAASGPANFLDIGGGASAEVMANGLEIVLSDPSVRSVLVNVFGGITSCDAVANGIVSALGLLGARGEQVDHPLVVRLDGNNAAEGRRILDEAGTGRGRAGRHHGRRGAARRRAGRCGRDGSMRWRSS